MHTSSSTPKRVRSTRRPALTLCANQGRYRRWRMSWHSPSATMTLSPFVFPVRAARNVVTIVSTE